MLNKQMSVVAQFLLFHSFLKTHLSKAGKLKQKFWIENYRWIIVIILLVIGIIILGLYRYQDSQDNHDQDATKNASLVSAPEVVLDTKETQTMQNPEMKEASQVLAKPDTPKSI